METTTPRPACAAESLDLLNCVADPSFDKDKCLRLLDALRACVLQKRVKKFSLAEQSHADEVTNNNDKPKNI